MIMIWKIVNVKKKDEECWANREDLSGKVARTGIQKNRRKRSQIRLLNTNQVNKTGRYEVQ